MSMVNDAAGRLNAMADALDAAADVYEVGGRDAVQRARRTLGGHAADFLLPEPVGERWAAFSTILPQYSSIALCQNAWLLRALALGLRRDAERLDQKGDA